jgi:hypothetical protein
VVVRDSRDGFPKVKLLDSWGLVGKQKAREIATVADSGTLDEVEEWREVLSSEGFEEAYLALLREAREAAGVEG